MARKLSIPKGREGGPVEEKRPRILLVDDDPGVLRLCSRALSSWGVTLLPRGRAQEVHESEAADLDLLITDLQMPGMSGLELLDLLRRRNPELPVLVITGSEAHDQDYQELVRRGLPILRKPFTLAELRAAAGALLPSLQLSPTRAGAAPLAGPRRPQRRPSLRPPESEP
jgi:CheY-like chemotaxis protein